MTVSPASRLDRTVDFVPDQLARQAELRSYRRFARIVGPRVAQPAPLQGIPTVLVPGFISGDVSLTMLARRLRRSGHRTFGSKIGANLGCTDAMVDRLIARLEVVVAVEGPVSLVGHSRGGMIVAIAARRRPDLVRSVVLLSAPVTGTLSVAAHVRTQLELLYRLNRRGLRSMMSEDCVLGECGDRVAAELASPFPETIPYLSIYTRSDAIIDWHTCLDPAAELVEVNSSHTGMATDPAVLDIVAERLTSLIG
ncbi:MAG: alpha/beta fold hydrolase [Jatrophihabitans sp.]